MAKCPSCTILAGAKHLGGNAGAGGVDGLEGRLQVRGRRGGDAEHAAVGGEARVVQRRRLLPQARHARHVTARQVAGLADALQPPARAPRLRLSCSQPVLYILGALSSVGCDF